MFISSMILIIKKKASSARSMAGLLELPFDCLVEVGRWLDVFSSITFGLASSKSYTAIKQNYQKISLRYYYEELARPGNERFVETFAKDCRWPFDAWKLLNLSCSQRNLALLKMFHFDEFQSSKEKALIQVKLFGSTSSKKLVTMEKVFDTACQGTLEGLEFLDDHFRSQSIRGYTGLPLAHLIYQALWHDNYSLSEDILERYAADESERKALLTELLVQEGSLRTFAFVLQYDSDVAEEWQRQR